MTLYQDTWNNQKYIQIYSIKCHHGTFKYIQIYPNLWFFLHQEQDKTAYSEFAKQIKQVSPFESHNNAKNMVGPAKSQIFQ